MVRVRSHCNSRSNLTFPPCITSVYLSVSRGPQVQVFFSKLAKPSWTDYLGALFIISKTQAFFPNTRFEKTRHYLTHPNISSRSRFVTVNQKYLCVFNQALQAIVLLPAFILELDQRNLIEIRPDLRVMFDFQRMWHQGNAVSLWRPNSHWNVIPVEFVERSPVDRMRLGRRYVSLMFRTERIWNHLHPVTHHKFVAWL